MEHGETMVTVQDDDINAFAENLKPKALNHFLYPPIQKKNLIVSHLFSEAFPLPMFSAKRKVLKLLKIPTCFISVTKNVSPFEEIVKSLISTGIVDDSQQNVELHESSSELCLSRYGSSIAHVPPETISITVKETETFYLFEMSQLTEDLDIRKNGIIQQCEKDVGTESSRKFVNSETQTPRVHLKSRSTFIDRPKGQNQGTFVNSWVMHDDYEALKTPVKGHEHLLKHSVLPMNRLLDHKEMRYKFQMDEVHRDKRSLEDQLSDIYNGANLLDAARLMERIISNNLSIFAQKRFKGLIRKDPCSVDLEFTYTLDLLWIHSYPKTKGKKVCCFRWNPVNGNLLAAGYGTTRIGDKNGILLVWCMKNPSQPDRCYIFDCQISDIDWSFNTPNLLAIGFYDGSIKIIDVNNKDLIVIRKSSRSTSISYSPHWQVQWWFDNENHQEQIYTSNQDGRILCYTIREDFLSMEILRIPKIEGKISGVKRKDSCNVYEVPISKYPGALLLRRHPDISTMFFVGSEEGCIYRCSLNYLHQHINHFLAHDGPICSLQFSPFCSQIFLTCGADWCTRIWADGITEPLITLSSKMDCVQGATWCPTNSTIIASVVSNEICIWDIKRKTYKPISVTLSPNSYKFVMLEFTKNGNQLVAADNEGFVYIYNLEGMPFSPFDQTSLLIKSIRKALITKPELWKKLKKLGDPF